MKPQSILAGMLLGAMICAPGFAFELIDKMLGLEHQGSQARDEQLYVNSSSSHTADNCRYTSDVTYPRTNDSLIRTTAACEPAACEPATCTPATCTPATCTPATCTPATCTPATCTPATCTPASCETYFVCPPWNPVRDAFLRLRLMFARDVYCEPACGPVCEPTCQPACGPVCEPTCQPACGPVCGPVVYEPCRPRPLLGVVNGLLSYVKIPVFCETYCGEPVVCGCGDGNCSGGDCNQVQPAEPRAKATTPAPKPPQTAPTAQRYKSTEDVRSTGFFHYGR